jgi:hypothetical protein
MPSYAAGPRPATVRLAQTSSQCIKETLNRYLPLPSSATKPANSVAPKPQIIARNRVRPRRSHKPSRSNLHSAPQPPVSLTAVSFPGGFRTPAPVQAASSRWAAIRNPSHEQTSAADLFCQNCLASSAAFFVPASIMSTAWPSHVCSSESVTTSLTPMNRSQNSTYPLRCWNPGC